MVGDRKKAENIINCVFSATQNNSLQIQKSPLKSTMMLLNYTDSPRKRSRNLTEIQKKKRENDNEREKREIVIRGRKKNEERSRSD